MEALAAVLRVTISFACGWAAVRKIQGFHGFSDAVAHYGLLPGGWSPYAAAVIVTSEVVVCLALLVDQTAIVGEALAAALFATYTAGMLVIVHRGGRVPCHCFGASDTEPVTMSTVARSAVIALVALVLLIYPGAIPALTPSMSLLVMTTAAGLTVALRMWTWINDAWGWLRIPAPQVPTLTRRRSYRYQSATASLFELDGTQPAVRSSLTSE